MSGTPVLLEEPQQISVAANAQMAQSSMPAASHSQKRVQNHARGKSRAYGLSCRSPNMLPRCAAHFYLWYIMTIDDLCTKGVAGCECAGTIVQLPKAASAAAPSRKHIAEGGLLAAITQVCTSWNYVSIFILTARSAGHSR